MKDWNRFMESQIEITDCMYCHEPTEETTTVTVTIKGVELNYFMCSECKTEYENK